VPGTVAPCLDSRKTNGRNFPCRKWRNKGHCNRLSPGYRKASRVCKKTCNLCPASAGKASSSSYAYSYDDTSETEEVSSALAAEIRNLPDPDDMPPFIPGAKALPASPTQSPSMPPSSGSPTLVFMICAIVVTALLAINTLVVLHNYCWSTSAKVANTDDEPGLPRLMPPSGARTSRLSLAESSWTRSAGKKYNEFVGEESTPKPGHLPGVRGQTEMASAPPASSKMSDAI